MTASTGNASNARERGLPDVLQSYSTELVRAGMLDLHGFVFREGKPFLSGRLTDDERAVADSALTGRRFTMGLCFRNAQRILEDDASGRLVYVEGFVLVGLAPTHHAWLAIGERVIDPTSMPTFEAIERALAAKRRPRARAVRGVLPRGQQYYGVRFDRGYVQRTIQARQLAAMRKGTNEYNTTMLDDWEHGHEIVRKGATGWRYVAQGGQQP